MNEIFGKRFKQLRQKLDLSQQDLIADFNKKYNYNFNRVAISQYENGKRIPEIDALTAFAEYFNVSVDYLLGRTYIPSVTDNTDTKNNNDLIPITIAEKEVYASKEEVNEIFKRLGKAGFDFSVFFEGDRLPDVTNVINKDNDFIK